MMLLPHVCHWVHFNVKLYIMLPLTFVTGPIQRGAAYDAAPSRLSRVHFNVQLHMMLPRHAWTGLFRRAAAYDAASSRL